jgi:hypothetical protein
VRDALQVNPLETLERVAAIGIRHRNRSGHSPEFLDKARDLGLAITGAHLGLSQLEGDLENVISKCQALENQVRGAFLG